MKPSRTRALAGSLLLLAAVGGLASAQPDPDSSFYHQALLNYKAGHYDAARLAIDDAEKQNPTDIATVVLKGRILTEQGHFDDGATLLRRFLTPSGPFEVQVALGDLFLRQRNFSAAANMYDQALGVKPDDTDTQLKLIYAKIDSSDLVTAAKYASQLKPFDPDNPSYYFAKAALAQATGKSAEVDQDIETARTVYGVMLTNRYMKTYYEVFAPQAKSDATVRSEPPPAATNAAPAAP